MSWVKVKEALEQFIENLENNNFSKWKIVEFMKKGGKITITLSNNTQIFKISINDNKVKGFYQECLNKYTFSINDRKVKINNKSIPNEDIVAKFHEIYNKLLSYRDTLLELPAKLKNQNFAVSDILYSEKLIKIEKGDE